MPPTADPLLLVSLDLASYRLRHQRTIPLAHARSFYRRKLEVKIA
jgi:hypothetical protein